MRDRLATAISAGSTALGHVTAVCATAAIALVFALVVARYGFGAGSPALQDAAQWLHAAAVLLGFGYALQSGAHVRIDVLSSRWSARTRARVELAGIVLLLWPFCAAVVGLSWDYVAMSWAMGERSASSGGLPGLFLVKGLVPLGALLLALQALAEALRTWPAAFGPEGTP